ncbi:MAG: hypothetical protein K0Q49_432 [Haloplasmataceae bacterium]|jgi:hypothetical protein|nr:hypothetical protein [Haloplasmataceae bacterium]
MKNVTCPKKVLKMQNFPEPFDKAKEKIAQAISNPSYFFNIIDSCDHAVGRFIIRY